MAKETTKDKVALVRERYETARAARMPQEQQWHINLAFLEGRQYVFWNSATSSLEQIRPVPHRVRHVSNIILPHWCRETARLGRNDPIFNVIPNTSDDSDVAAARVAEAVLQYLWRKLMMSRKYLEAREWLSALGTVFFDVGWDPKAGDPVRRPVTELVETPVLDDSGEAAGARPEERPFIGADGEPVVDEFRLGEIYCDVLSPFEIYPASDGITSVDDQPWIVKARVRPVKDIKRDYPDAASKIEPQDVRPELSPGRRLASSASGAPDDASYAVVLEMREKPSPARPQGRVLIVCGDVLLHEGPLPFGKYNLVRIRRIRIPGSFWGESPIVASIPLQKEWNKILSQVIEHRETMKKGKILIPTTAEVRKAAFTSEHAEIIYYNPTGGPPFQMQLHPLPADVWKELDVIKEVMMDIWSQHEVSRAYVPAGVRSGVAIEQLIEQDETTLGAVFRDITDALTELGARMLEIVEARYTETRTLKVVGDERGPDVKNFIGADLRGNHDVFVNIGSALPFLKITRHQEIKDRYRLGLYGPPDDPEVRRKVLRLLEDTVVEDIYDDDRLDEANARRECQTMMTGTQVPARSYDNHRIHIKVHNHYRKLYEFEEAARWSPEIETLFDEHVRQHERMLAEEELADMEEEFRAGGTI